VSLAWRAELARARKGCQHRLGEDAKRLSIAWLDGGVGHCAHAEQRACEAEVRNETCFDERTFPAPAASEDK
jgi:hypothetical protein